ncbi:MAG: MASE1 domain-containing protein [Candidatus Acidiferrales bacterium]
MSVIPMRFIGGEASGEGVRAEKDGSQLHPLRNAFALVALTVIYVVVGTLSLKLAYDHPSASPVWPPTGIALAVSLILGYRVWPAIWLGAFLVNAANFGSIATSAGIASGNTLEALLGAWLANRFANGSNPFDSAVHVVRFTILSAVASPLVSATVGVTSLALGGFLAWTAYGSIWMTWWLGNMVGAMVVAPLVLVWWAKPRLRWKPAEALEAALWFMVLTAGALLAFAGLSPFDEKNLPLAFFHIALVIGVAIRFGLREAITALAIVSAVAVWGTLRGHGPFSMASAHQSLLLVQIFVGVGSALILVQAAVIAERRRVELRLQAFFDQAVVGIAEWDAKGRFVRVNRRLCEMLGYTEQQLLSRTFLDLTDPHDLIASVALFEGLKKEGTPYSIEKRFRRSDGGSIWVRKSVSRVIGPGQRFHMIGVVDDVSDTKQAEETLKKATVLEERNRLAGEIHDSLAQAFVAVTLQLECAEAVLERTGGAAKDHVIRAKHVARGALEEARRAIQSLRPHLLDSAGLPEALRAAAERLFAGSGIELDFSFEGRIVRLASNLERELFYIGQEAMTNVLRHSGATKVQCKLCVEANELRLRVSDNGRGLSPGQAGDHSIGLSTMRERAQRIGAVVNIESKPGEGMTVQVILPLRTAPSA